MDQKRFRILDGRLRARPARGVWSQTTGSRCAANPAYAGRGLFASCGAQVIQWDELIGDPTLADGILDRLVHNAYRIEMRGDSMRKRVYVNHPGWDR